MRLNCLSAAAAAALLGLAGCGSTTGSTASETSSVKGSPAVAAETLPAGAGVRYSLAYPTGNRATGVVLLEADSPDQVRVGQPFKYTLRVTNLTDFPVQNVRVRDTSESSGTAITTGGTTRPAHEDPITWDVGYLAPKQTVSKEIAGVADEVGSIHNCLAVSYSPTLCVAIAVVKPELQISKEGPSEVKICQDITYTYNVTNTGTGVAQAVRVQDRLPEGLITSDGKKEVIEEVGDLPQGQNKKFSVNLHAMHTGQFASRAVAQFGDVQTKSREVSTHVVAPALAITVEGPESRYVNEPVDYRVAVHNTGDAASENTVVHLTSSTGETIADHTIGTLQPNQTSDFVVTTRSGSTGANQTLNASATGTCVEKPATNKATVAIVTVPALRLGVVHSVDPVRQGNNTVYTISVANTGSGADRNVIVTATVPAEEQFVSGKGATPVSANGQEISFGPIATLNPGETATWNVEVKAVKASDAVFHAVLKSDTMTKPAEKLEPTRIVP